MKTRITLYHDCILSARYTEVFRNQTLLDAYLNGLTKPYTGDIDIPKVYTTLTGTVSIDTSEFNNAYNTFNYIKFEEIDDNNVVKQKVYAFVDTIRIINDLYVITYSVDVWHTYFKDCTLRESLITNSLWREKSNYTSLLPLQPMFNGKRPDIDRDMTGVLPNNDLCIIAKIQFYDLDNGTPKPETFKESYYVLDFVKGLVEQTQVPTYEFYTFTSIERGIFQTSEDGIGNNTILLTNILDTLYQKQNSRWGLYTTKTISGVDYNGFDFSNQITKRYGNIVKLYVLPRRWITNNESNTKFKFDLELENTYCAFVVPDTETQTISYLNGCNGICATPLSKSNNDFVIYSKTIEKNYHNIALGFYTSYFKYDYIGRDIDVKITASINRDEFELYLYYNGCKTEITTLFEYMQDYTVVSAETYAQREIARKIDTVSGIMGTIQGITQIAVGVATGALGGANVASGESILGALSDGVAFGGHEFAIQSSALSKFNTGRMQEVHGGQGVVGGLSQLVNSTMKIWGAQADKYAPIHSQHNNSTAIINAQFGFIVYYSTGVLNLNEMDKAVREIGYQVNYITNNIDIDTASNLIDKSVLDNSLQLVENYNVVKFGFVRLVGLSTEICEKIASILTGGVKIWYVSNV